MVKNCRKHLNQTPSGRENRQVLMHMFVLFHENDSWTRQNFSRNLKNWFTHPLELDFAFSANRADDGKWRHTWRLNRNISEHLSAVSDPISHFHLFPGCFGQNVAEISSRSVWNDEKMRISALHQENIYRPFLKNANQRLRLQTANLLILPPSGHSAALRPGLPAPCWLTETLRRRILFSVTKFAKNELFI